MDVLYQNEIEFGFGLDPFNPRQPRSIEAVSGTDKPTLRRRIMQSCPRVPGVYGMLDRKGQLIYVGKSKSLRSRLLSYFSPANEEEKGGRIIENARAIQWETQPSEFGALLREQQLIRLYSPRWNVQGVPKRQRPVYLCLGKAPAPQFYLSAKPPEEAISIQGPFFGSKRMKVAVDTLNKVFALRDCGQQQVFQFAEQLSLFEIEHRPGCLRLELETCLGPCAAGCTRAEYDGQVEKAKRFLNGFDDEPLLDLERRMKSASINQQYELAARMHIALKSLRYVYRKLNMLADARKRFSFVYAVPGYDGCHNWYLIHRGEVCEVSATPVGSQAYRSMKPKISTWKAVLENDTASGHGPFAYTLGTVASWFRKNRSELEQTFSPSQAGRKYYRMRRSVR